VAGSLRSGTPNPPSTGSAAPCETRSSGEEVARRYAGYKRPVAPDGAERENTPHPILVLPDDESDIDENEDAEVEQLGSDVSALWHYCATNMYRKSKSRAKCAVATVRPDMPGKRHPRVAQAAAVSREPVRAEVQTTDVSEAPAVLDENSERKFVSVGALRAAVKMARRRQRLQRKSHVRNKGRTLEARADDKVTRR